MTPFTLPASVITAYSAHATTAAPRTSTPMLLPAELHARQMIAAETAANPNLAAPPAAPVPSARTLPTLPMRIGKEERQQIDQQIEQMHHPDQLAPPTRKERTEHHPKSK